MANFVENLILKMDKMQKITKNDIAEALNYKAWQRFFRKRTVLRKQRRQIG